METPTDAERPANASRSRRAWGEALLVAALVLAAAAVRLDHLDDWGLWDDEALGYHIALGNTPLLAWAHEPGAGVLDFPEVAVRRGSLAESHRSLRALTPWGPAYYDLVHLADAAGLLPTPEAGRGWNLLFAAATALGVWSLARRGLSPPAAALAVVLFALSSWDVAVSTQLKAYGLASAAAVWATWSLLRLRDAPRHRWVRWSSAYGVAVGLGLLGHYQVLWGVMLHGPWLAVSSRFDVRRLLAWGGGLTLAVLVASPWILWAGPGQLNQIGTQVLAGTFDGVGAMPGKLWDSLRAMLLPVPTGFGDRFDAALFGLLLALVAAGAAGLPGLGAEARRVATLAGSVFWGAMAVAALLYAVSQSNQTLWPRYLTPFLPLAWAAAAAAAEGAVRALAGRIPGRRPQRPGLARAAGFLPVAVLAIPLWAASGRLAEVPVDRANDWREHAARLAALARPGDLMLHVPAYSAFLGFATYWQGETRHLAPRIEPSGRLSPEAVEALRGAPGRGGVLLVLTWSGLGQEAALTSQLAGLGLSPAERIAEAGMIAVRFVEASPAPARHAGPRAR